MKLQRTIKGPGDSYEVQIFFNQRDLSARLTIYNRGKSRQSERPGILSRFRSVAELLLGRSGASQEAHQRDSTTIIADSNDDAALLLDVLLEHPDEGSHYVNAGFRLERNYSRPESEENRQIYPCQTFYYDLAHLKLGFVGRLTAEDYERMSAEIKKCYSTSERLGEHKAGTYRLALPPEEDKAEHTYRGK